MIARLIETYEIYLAALITGIIIVPGSEMLKTNDLQYRITHGEVRGVVSYYPYVDEFKGVKEYERLIKFRSEEHTSELQSRGHLVCRLLLEKKNRNNYVYI